MFKFLDGFKYHKWWQRWYWYNEAFFAAGKRFARCDGEMEYKEVIF